MVGMQLKTPQPGGEAEAESTLLHIINEELKALYNYLEKHQVSGDDMTRVLEPLVAAVEGTDVATSSDNVHCTSPTPHTPPSSSTSVTTTTHHSLSSPISTLTGTMKVFFTCLLLALAVYLVWQVPIVNKIVVVLLRHFQLLLLPYWDWTRLYYADCLVSNPFYVRQPLTSFDCNVCESVESLDVLSALSVAVATDEYLRDDRPFLVSDAMTDWPVMNTDDFWFDNITELYQSSELRDVYPCELTTNLRVPLDDLQTFLKRIHMPAVDRWYGHWENCNKRAARALRPFYRRPYFMPHMVDFSDTNWVIMSSDYKAKVYKEIMYQSEVLWLAAVRGWWHVRIVPLHPCHQHCPELTATVTEGQMIVVTNRLWKLEYIPGEETDNLALAVGGFWN